MSNTKLMEMAKEITIAKLSTSSPTRTNEDVGKEIAAMYTAIYLGLSEINPDD